MDEQNTKHNSAAEPLDELGECKKQRDDYLAGWQRAKADFINYKKEELQRLQDIARYAGEELMSELVGVLDSFDLGIRSLEKTGGEVDKGVYMIRAQMEDVLRKQGLMRIPIAPLDHFDPRTMEAIAEVESEKPEGTIIEEIEPGYRLHDKVLRPARVKVSKGQKQQGESSE